MRATRLRLLSMLVGACTAWPVAAASPEPHEEAVRALLAGFDDETVAPQQLINKLVLFDAQRLGTQHLLRRLKGTADEKQRGRSLQALSGLAVAIDGTHASEEAAVLVSALSDHALGNRMSAAKTLGRLRASAATGPLKGLLRDPAPGARREAARALGAIGQASSSTALIAAASLEDEPETRACLLLAVRDRGAISALEPFLRSPSESTRFAAARVLMQLRAPSGEAFVRRALGSSDALERLQGLQTIEGLRSPLLRRMVDDRDDDVRATAARMLAEEGDASRVEGLVREHAKKPNAQAPDARELERLNASHQRPKALLEHAGAP